MRSEQALARARMLSHPFTLIYALHFAAWLAKEYSELERLNVLLKEETNLCREHEVPFYSVNGMLLQGWLLAERGEMMAAQTLTEQGLEAFRALRQELRGPYFRAVAAETFAKVGRRQQALDLLDEAFRVTDITDQRFWQAELLRLKGRILLQAGANNEDVEEYFRRAITTAQLQQAKSLELRTATSVSRLWLAQDRHDEARSYLTEIYGWFTDGFNTRDLREARGLLDQLG